MEEVDLKLAAEVARFYADPLGFVMFAYPWSQPGPLAKHEGPDAHNVPGAPPSVLPRLVTAFEAVRAGKIPATQASRDDILYRVDDISFLMLRAEAKR